MALAIPVENPIINFSRGNFGGNFGSFFSPLVGFISVYLIYNTFKEQQKSNIELQSGNMLLLHVKNYDIYVNLVNETIFRFKEINLKYSYGEYLSGVKAFEKIKDNASIAEMDISDKDLNKFYDDLEEILNHIDLVFDELNSSQMEASWKEHLKYNLRTKSYDFMKNNFLVENYRNGLDTKTKIRHEKLNTKSIKLVTNSSHMGLVNL